jgi:hypothetical protein
VDEISVILKNNSLITTEEFSVLNRCSYFGKVWTVVDRPIPGRPYLITYKAAEYIFDPEALTIFCIVSRNVFLQWDTNCTKCLKPNEEFHLKDSIFLRVYDKHR